MSNFTRKSQFTLLAASLFLSVSVPALAQEAGSDAWMERAAKGTLSEQGGARRLSGDVTKDFRGAIVDGKPKNVILLIGDGMGDSEITIARNYALGAGEYFKGIDALPVTGQYTHYALDRKTGKPDYVTDSAASGTAWASGVKTYNGGVGVDIHGKPHVTLLQLAKAAGLATGNVTTSELQDATPAVQVAHVTARKCYGPVATAEKCAENALENGGKGSITEQLLNTRADVTLGGGAKTFEEVARAGEWKDKTLKDQASERGYQLVSNLEGLQSVTKADDSAPLLGLFAEGNMPVRWEGPAASEGGLQGEPVTCKVNEARGAGTPTLAQMTSKAIDLLKGNEKGFFLQVEGASIDKQNHAGNPCGQIGETVDLDEAVQEALKFAKADGNTLIIVTADHAHSSQIVAPDSKLPGFGQALVTKDGSVMGISYGNSEVLTGQEHTGAQLRVAAFGPFAANVTGLTDQTDIFFTIRDALSLQSEKAQLN
jgi:alkaline phosphatase